MGFCLFYYEDFLYVGRWFKIQFVEYVCEILGFNCVYLYMDLNRIWVDKFRGCKNYVLQIEDEIIFIINNYVFCFMGGEG